MLGLLGYSTLEALVAEAVPAQIRLRRPLQLPAARSEHEVLAALKAIASQNQVFRSYIGMGYYDCITPPVILRNLFENPGWYTPYTPYQAEIAQGRLEALLNFQTMVIDLTGLDVANASLLDEATAAAEAMTMFRSLKPGRAVFFVSNECHPQTIDVVKTRAGALGIEVVTGDHQTFQFSDQVFGALVQYPNTFGVVHDYSGFIEQAHAAGALVAVAADLLSLTLLRPPGEFGADVGPRQRATVWRAARLRRSRMRRTSRPGTPSSATCPDASWGCPRIRAAALPCGSPSRPASSTSAARRLPATSAPRRRCWPAWRRCTRATTGPPACEAIARRIHLFAEVLALGLRRLGYQVGPKPFFDTICVGLGDKSLEQFANLAEAHRMNFRAHRRPHHWRLARRDHDREGPGRHSPRLQWRPRSGL